MVACDLDANGKDVIIITGANQGGGIDFFRSLGLCQVMLNAGMFVPASIARASIACGAYTHFGRQEDRTMERGKLDEELKRCADLIQRLQPYGMVLFNEAFSSTNELEGADVVSRGARFWIPEAIPRQRWKCGWKMLRRRERECPRAPPPEAGK